MPSPALFRGAIIASLVLALLAGVIDVVLPGLIDPGIAAAQEAAPVSPLLESWWVLGALTLLLGAWLAASIGLALFRPWAPRLALATSVLLVAATLPLGASVSSSLAAALAEVATALWGAVLAAAYFSPLKQRFEALAPRA